MSARGDDEIPLSGRRFDAGVTLLVYRLNPSQPAAEGLEPHLRCLPRPFTAPHRHIRIRQRRPRECERNGQGHAADRIRWVPPGAMSSEGVALLEACARGGPRAPPPPPPLPPPPPSSDIVSSSFSSSPSSSRASSSRASSPPPPPPPPRPRPPVAPTSNRPCRCAAVDGSSE